MKTEAETGAMWPQAEKGLEPLEAGRDRKLLLCLRAIGGAWPCCHLFFFPRHFAACGILVPQPGFKPSLPVLEALCPNHWTVREVPRCHLDFRLLQNFE